MKMGTNPDNAPAGGRPRQLNPLPCSSICSHMLPYTTFPYTPTLSPLLQYHPFFHHGSCNASTVSPHSYYINEKCSVVFTIHEYFQSLCMSKVAQMRIYSNISDMKDILEVIYTVGGNRLWHRISRRARLMHSWISMACCWISHARSWISHAHLWTSIASW